MHSRSRYLLQPVGLLLLAIVLYGCTSTRSAVDESRSDLVVIPSAGEIGDPQPIARELRRFTTDGVQEAVEEGPRHFDLYVASAIESELDSSLVWSAFRQMLSVAPSLKGDTARAHLEQHLALSELLYDRADVEGGTTERRAAFALKWWTDEASAPASMRNDRLLEHLNRVAQARMHYTSQGSATGLDARGETLVRFGPPSRMRQVRFEEAELLRSFLRDGLPIRTSDFPDNEVWIYDHLGRSAVFLFVEGSTRGGYFLGSVNDLMPRQLRTRGVTGSARADVYAQAALRALRYVFSQLALYHPSYDSRYDVIADHVNWHEERAIGQRLGGREHGRVAGFDALTSTLARALARNDREDQNLEARRIATIPAQFAAVERAEVPLALRVVRRLDRNGGTRIHLYSQADLSAYPECVRRTNAVPANPRLRVLSYRPGFGAQRVILDTLSTADDWGSVNHHSLPLAEATAGIALQFDGLEDFAGPCTGVASVGALAPLDPYRAGVEMSDLLPFMLTDVLTARSHLENRRFSDDDFVPLAANDIGGEEGIGVYFEIYTDTDLQEAVMIEYEVRKTGPGGVLRRARVSESVYQARQASIDQRLPAAFLIDRSEWEGARSIEVVVRVTNLETGREAERALNLTIAG